MKMLKQYLALGAIFFAGSVNATDMSSQEDFDTQPQEAQDVEIAASKSAAVNEFENLAEIALKSNKASFVGRAGVGVIKELAKLFGTVAIPLLAIKGNQYEKLSDSQFAAIMIIFMVFSQVFCESIIYKSDKSLVALQNLKKCVALLKPEDKKEIIALFREKYADKLSEKIAQEKDGKVLFIGRSAMALVDALALPLLLIYFLKCKNFDLKELTKFKGVPISVLDILGYLPAALNASAVLFNAWYSTDYQKKCALQKIEAALA
ncbi:MAG: hypothetical protein US49_C0001G0085 [candidate division TM6 bacterium GW2011_GWF2_37_49]|nr:MAG: hypothetical protein US49_C0001G0085 [candidate division TM6 bacterium GW2011_GWF2_37_49]